MRVYHGSNNKFEKFDYEQMGLNGTARGYGFYFTDSKEFARKYAHNGYILEVEFTGRKFLSEKKKTITKAQLKKLVIKLNELDEFLSNYGDTSYGQFNKVLTEAVDNLYNYNDNDVDIIGDICNSYGRKDVPLRELYLLAGYDSIKAVYENDELPHTVYIATVHEAYNIIGAERVV